MNTQCPICNENYTPGFNVPKKPICEHVVCVICAYHEIHTKGQYSCYSCDECIKTDRELRALPVDYSKYTIQKQENIMKQIRRANDELMAVINLQKQRSIARNQGQNMGGYNDFQAERIRRQMSYDNASVTLNVAGVSVSRRGIFIEKSASNGFDNDTLMRQSLSRSDGGYYSQGFENSQYGSMSIGQSSSNQGFGSGQIGFNNYRSMNRGFSSSTGNQNLMTIDEEKSRNSSSAKFEEELIPRDKENILEPFEAQQNDSIFRKRRQPQDNLFNKKPKDKNKLSDFAKWHNKNPKANQQKNISQNTFLSPMKLENVECVIPECQKNCEYNYTDKKTRFCSKKCELKWPNFPKGQPEEETYEDILSEDEYDDNTDIVA